MRRFQFILLGRTRNFSLAGAPARANAQANAQINAMTREKINRRRFLFAASLFATLASGCQLFTNGHFEGNLSRNIDGQSTIVPVGIDVDKNKIKKVATLNVTGRKRELLMKLQVKDISHSSFSLLIPPISENFFRLKKKGRCYVATETVRVDACFEDKSFFVTVTDANKAPVFILTGDPFPEQIITPLEPSITIRLTEAVDRAIEKNFRGQEEIESAFQAKKGAEEAYLNLLPHISGETAINIGESIANPIALVSSIGDLAPFLLPNRWLEAKEASNVGRAAEIGKLLMQANLIAQVEGLAYVFERDRKILLIIDQTIEWLGGKGKKIKSLQAQKQLPDGTFENFSSLSENLISMRSDFAESLEISRAGFSNTLGYLNPEAIDFVDLGEETITIDNATPWPEKEDLADVAIYKSFELNQLHFLIEASATQKLMIFFTWLDPQGSDSHSNLGFATGSRMEIAKSRIRELEVKQKQLEAILRTKAYATVRSYNTTLENYRREKGAYQKAGVKLDGLVRDIIDKKVFDQATIQAEIQEFIGKIINEQNRLATFRIARSKIDRIQLQGFYQRAVQKYLNEMMEPGNNMADQRNAASPTGGLFYF